MVFVPRLETSGMRSLLFSAFSLLLLFSCNSNESTAEEKAEADSTANAQQTVTNNLDSLPKPYATKSVDNHVKVTGWKNNQEPTAPDGFTVSIFADNLQSPRWMYVAANGDVFVAQADREGKKGNNILLFRDKNKDGVPESKTVYLQNLNQPFGMLVINNKFYVANTDALLEYPYDSAATSITAPPKQLVALPGKGRHWTRNIITNPAKNK